MDDKQTVQRNKISLTIIEGYQCRVCHWDNVVYNSDKEHAPKVCLNCGADAPVLKWRDRVKNVTTVETLEIK